MRTVLVACIMILCAGSGFAQYPGSIGIFADVGASDCHIFDTGQLLNVEIFHLWTDGAVASQFRLDIGSTGWMYISETWNFPVVVGSALGGVAIAYEGCLQFMIHLGTVHFLGSSAPQCTYVRIVGDPMSMSGEIEAVDCSTMPVIMYPRGGEAIVNPDPELCWCLVPAHETSWGRVKALYR